MNISIDKSETRGHANYGWLDTYHSFSFSSYFNQEKMGFGLLRVLNDDTVAPGSGFGLHSHSNMEIISIPLEGSLRHTDNTGNSEVINMNEVQLMSAGTYIQHSEFNASDTGPVNFFQIWIYPRKMNTEPHYEQMKFDPLERKNKFQTIVAPDANNALIIQQNAYLSFAEPDAGQILKYDIKIPGNGVYLILIEGEIEIDGNKLNRRDAAGITDTQNFEIRASADSFLLVIEIPMVRTS